jgi:uncharacterized RDD family membrane protein YckC
MTMTADDYVERVLARLPHTAIRGRVEMEVRALIADRIERGESMAEVERQLGDPAALADSYLAEQPMEAATFFARAIAKGIDLIAMEMLVALVATMLALSVIDVTSRTGQQFLPIFIACAIAVSLLIWPAYTAISEYAAGYTLGKWLLGLRVVQESGAHITAGQAFVRQLALFGQVFIIDALFALFTEKHQRAFELASKTRVIRAE